MNLIGEPTTVMFRKGDMADSRPHLMSYAGESAHRNGDMSIWTSLLSRGDAVNISASMSFFRQHGTQVQKDPAFRREAQRAWRKLIDQAGRTGLQDEIHCTNTTSVNLQGSDDVTVGETLFSDGNIQDAVSVFQTTLSRNPAQAQARGNLSCACWEMGWHPRALVEGVLAAGSDPDNETLSLNLQDMLAVEAN